MKQFLTNTTFIIGTKKVPAYSLNCENDYLMVNGRNDFQRVHLNKKHFRENNIKFKAVKKQKIFWQSNVHKPLSKGKYKITYNNVDYFMTYLDELEMFLSVVIQV